MPAIQKKEIELLLARMVSLIKSPFIYVVLFGSNVPIIIFDYLIAVYFEHLINTDPPVSPISTLKKKIIERKYSLMNILFFLPISVFLTEAEEGQSFLLSFTFATLYIDRHGFTLFGEKSPEDGVKDPKILLYNLGIMLLITLISAGLMFFIGRPYIDDLSRFRGYPFLPVLPDFLTDFLSSILSGFVGMLVISFLRPPFGLLRLSTKKINPFVYSLVFLLIFCLVNKSIHVITEINRWAESSMAAKFKQLHPPKNGFAAIGLNIKDYDLLDEKLSWPYPKFFFRGQAKDISVECRLSPDGITQRFIMNYRLPTQVRVDSFRFRDYGNLYFQTFRDSNSYNYVHFETEFATQAANQFELAEDEVRIFHKVFMLYNLAVDRFRNGDTIFQARTPEEWKYAAENQVPAWCYPDAVKLYRNHGKLYNAYAVTDPRGLAPEGWRIPYNYELEFVKNYQEAVDLSDDHLRQAHYWNRRYVKERLWKGYPVNIRCSDGGWRTYGREVYLDEYFAAWWCIAPYSPQYPSGLILSAYQRAEISDNIDRGAGLSVRCVKE